MDTERTLKLLSLGFPTSVIGALLNVGLSSAAFWPLKIVHGKLPATVQKLMRFSVSSTVALAASTLGLWNWANCGKADMCTTTPVEETACLQTQSVTVVLLLLGLFVERGAYAASGIPYTRMARTADSVGLAMVWLFLSERDPLCVLSVGALLLRKTTHLVPRAGRAATALASLSLLCVCLLAAGGQCSTVSVKNAAGGALFAVFVACV